MPEDGKTIKKKTALRGPRPRKALVLTVLSGENIGKEFVLDKSRTTIGRDESADIVVCDRLISRRHAELTVQKGAKRLKRPGVVLTDLNSTNGTFINYQPIRRAALKEGDKILLGQTILKLEYKDPCDQQFLARLRRGSSVDGLTGLRNKTSILQIGREEFARSRRYRRPFSVMMLDIDHFKTFNDTYGHLTGDQVLKEVGGRIASAVREQDETGRFGGEEFLVLLPETRLPDARRVAERLVETVRALALKHKSTTLHVTVSVGICSNQESAPESFEALVERADQALYAAKRSGRDRMVTWSETPAEWAEKVL